jgi:tRNA-Thr(GGU) m(6)t(6)A37 methyltransferase TsaA
MDGLETGSEIFVFTWLHLAHRETMKVYPRGNPPLTGVFATRSPDRPNPIGLHRTRLLEIAGNEIRVECLEAVDRTPVIDIKPVLDGGR